jgi:G:T-mismatch repair DNA endonuclease (very short patch repair protein)
MEGKNSPKEKRVAWNKGKKFESISWEQRELRGWGKVFTCPNCQERFYRQKNAIRGDALKLCSKKCYYEYRKGLKLYGWDYLTCTNCKKDFSRHKYLKGPKNVLGVFCNMACYSEWKSVHGNTQFTKMTKPEKMVEEILKDLGVSYEYNKNFTSEEYGNCYYDFYIPKNNLVIEVDGNYWHGNPKFYQTLNEQQQQCKIRDLDKERNLKHIGIHLERVWESEIDLNLIKSILTKY